MSGPKAMTCERCSELITELVCGELDAAAAADVRAHAEQCPTCGPELASFTRVLSVAQSLPLEAPSPALEQRVMQAAREANARRAAGAQAIDSGSPSSGLRAWLERLATWAMSPQVAMASVLLLVVGIGLYALPFGPDASGPTALQIAQEEPTAKLAPAATAASAPIPAEELADDEAEAAEAPAAPAASAAKRTEARAEPSKVLRARKDDEGSDPLANLSRGEKARRPGKSATEAELDLADGYGVGAASSGRSVDFAPPPPVEEKGKKESAARPAAKPAEPVHAQFAEPAAPAPAPDMNQAASDSALGGAASREATAPDFTQQLDEGVRASQAGAHARAIELLEPVVSKGPANLRSTARTWLARSLRALDQCERALVHYRPLVANENAAPALLQEAADCYQRTGQPELAASLRSRLPSTRN